MLGDLHGVTSRGRYLPNLWITKILAIYKVDPFAIVRPAGRIIAMHIDVELVGNPTTRIDEVNVGFAPYARIEGDQLTVGRPSRCSGGPDAKRAELQCIRAV